MMSRLTGYRRVAVVFWALATIAIVLWSQVPGYLAGWDLDVYKNAIHAMQAGHDPYVDGVAVQRVFHATLAQHPNDPPPYTYVYSPLTLPLLRWIGSFPFGITAPLYWLAYWAGLLTAIWVGMQAVEEKERRWFTLLSPLAVFFPGLLQNDVFFSGDIAYIFYGLVLAASVRGWRKNRWEWFYVAVLAASCCKAPMLSLVAIPVLSARRQWLPAGLTGAAGVFLFAMQPHWWPTLFRNYLVAVELQFSFNHDFSCSPAGLLADALYYVVPYQKTSAIFYLFYAVLVAGVLLYLRKKFLAGEISQKRWVPVMLVGVILLNPRIMEYDVAPITISLALLAWRLFDHIGRSTAHKVVGLSVFFAVINIAAAAPLWGGTKPWKVTECMVLVGLFVAGAWDLSRARGGESVSASMIGKPGQDAHAV